MRIIALQSAVAGMLLSIVGMVAAVAGFTKAEVERIWLFLAPLACIAAAAAMQTERLRLVLVLLAAQALAWELVRNTVW